jgi:predicted nucleic acid-binding protein
MTLVDSSICVAFLRKNLPQEGTHRFSQLILDGELAMTVVIWAELYGGVRGKREDSEFQNLVALSRMFQFTDDCWQHTAEINRACVRRGINVPLSDIQIQACAKHYKLALWHQDHHFDLIQEALRP